MQVKPQAPGSLLHGAVASPLKAAAASTACFPLSEGQEQLWFMEQMNPGSAAYNIPEAWRLRGSLQVDALCQALRQLVVGHESLRTSFLATQGKPVQLVHAATAVEFEPELVDLRRCADGESKVQELMAEEARRPFELARPPLFRARVYQLGPDDHVLFLNVHHLVADEWSIGILMRELQSLYGAAIRGAPPPLKRPKLQYADFAVWQREQATSPAIQAQLAWWQQRLAGDLPAVELPATYHRPATLSGRGDTVFQLLPGSLAQEAAAFSRAHGATLFMTLLAGFKALVSRYTGQTDVIVGSTFAGRTHVDTEDITGFFVHTHALRTRVPDELSFLQLVDRVRDTVVGAAANQDVSFEAIVNTLRTVRDTSHHPVFQVLFALQPLGVQNWSLEPGIDTNPIELHTGTAKFDVSLLFTETRDGLKVRCEYSTDLYDTASMGRLLQHYQVLLEAALARPETKISELSLLTEAERKQILVGWNSRGLEYPKEKYLHQLFEEQAVLHPESVAVICGREALTYGELNEQATRVGTALRSHLQHSGRDVAIGVCMDRSLELVVSLLGILKAGAAYLPLDPAYPAERLAFMLADAAVPLLLTRRNLAATLPVSSATVLCIEDLSHEPDGRELPALRAAEQQSALAYILYTSGSTGRPKGVALKHRGAVALMYWARETYSSAEISGVLAGTSICFDLSVFELFVPLSWGGKVVLAENALSLYGLPEPGQVTLINTVPSAIRELLRLKAVPDSVKVINLAGEPLTTELVDRLYSETSVQKIYDLYGPTETTTYSTFTLRQPGAAPSIGRPLPNEQVYVVDRHLQPVPVGVPGELLIGGDGLARGYVNRPELTAEKFIAHPFKAEARVYRTGDQARWRPDGTLEYLGRLDHQVKIRGFRIELAEVEAALKADPAVAETVVVAHEPTSGTRRLVAYLVCKPGVDVTESALRDNLRRGLPEFMLPSAFVFLTALPMTPNGKIDRRALPQPNPAEVLIPPSEPSNSPIELKIADIWSDVLGRNRFGRDDNFFLLGGHSLLATQVIARMDSTFNVEVPLRTIFEHPTIAGLARAVQDPSLVRAVAQPPPMLPRRAQHSKMAPPPAGVGVPGANSANRPLREPELKSTR